MNKRCSEHIFLTRANEDHGWSSSFVYHAAMIDSQMQDMCNSRQTSQQKGYRNSLKLKAATMTPLHLLDFLCKRKH